MTVDTSTEAVTKLLDGVSKGPWRVEYKHGTTCLMMGDSCQMCNETYYPWVPANERDWHFIAAARDLVPALLAERDALKAEVERLKAERDEATEGWHVIHPNITVQDAAMVPEIAALLGLMAEVIPSLEATKNNVSLCNDLRTSLRAIVEGRK